jgi:hypothetical protein
MADIKTAIIAKFKSMTKEEKEGAKVILIKLGIDIKDIDMQPRKTVSTAGRQVLVQEYNLEIFHVCLTCGCTTEQFFRMQKLSDNSGTFSKPLLTRNTDGPWKTEFRSIRSCGHCYKTLISLYTLEDLARVIVILGQKGYPIAEVLVAKGNVCDG